ncbi:MAG: hypothetical protein HFG31_07870 [Eubacterium sp.]|nr:hypothetical protein [Eubacterium sp.]
MENNICLTWKQKALSMFGWTMKRYKGISIAYAAMLFITFPLIEILVIFQNKKRFTSDGVIDMSALNVVGTLFVLVAVIFATVFAIVSFSYMHNKRCVDLFGSLPMSRRTLFFTRYISVLVQTIVPLLIMGTMGALLTMKSEYFISSMKMVAMLVLGVTGIVSFIAVLSLCCGTVVDVIVSFLVINGVYPICILICNMFPATILPGFGIEENVNFSLYTLLSPVFAPFAGIWEREKTLYIVWWIVFSIILTGVCYILSKKRKAETAQNAFVFVMVEQVIKFFSGFTVGFGMGWIFAQIGGNSNESYKSQYVWFFVGLCIGAFLTAGILHLIYHRGISKILSSLLIGVADIVVAVVFVVVIITGAFGYDERVPDVRDIEAVSVALNGQGSYHVDGKDIRKNYISERAFIETVVGAHKVIIKREMAEKDGTYPIDMSTHHATYEGDEEYVAEEVEISYRLKNGEIIHRDYIGIYSEEEVVKMSQSLGLYKNEMQTLKEIPLDDIDRIEMEEEQDIRINLTGSSDKIKKMKEAVMRDYDSLGIEKADFGEVVYTLYFPCYNSRDEYIEIKIPITQKCKNTMKILDTEYKNIELLYYEQSLTFNGDMYSKAAKKTVYFRMPDKWDKEAKVSAVLYDSDVDGFSSNGLMDVKNQCKKVKDNLWEYTYRNMENEDEDGYQYTRIMFYQVLDDSVNISGCIRLPDSLEKKCLILGKKKKRSIDDYDVSMYKYQWQSMK